MILFFIGAFVLYMFFWYLHSIDKNIEEKEFKQQNNNILNRYEVDGDLKVINNMEE